MQSDIIQFQLQKGEKVVNSFLMYYYFQHFPSKQNLHFVIVTLPKVSLCSTVLELANNLIGSGI